MGEKMAIAVLEPPGPIKYLRKKGIENGRIYRGYRLAKKSQIIYVDRDNGVVKVLVPSQRLGKIRPVKLMPHTDIVALAKGIYKHTLAEVGELPINQQYYIVEITPSYMKCSCPDTIYNKSPLCIHKIAAITRAYIDLGEEFVEENYGNLLNELIKKYRGWNKSRSRLLHRVRRVGSSVKLSQDKTSLLQS